MSWPSDLKSYRSVQAAWGPVQSAASFESQSVVAVDCNSAVGMAAGAPTVLERIAAGVIVAAVVAVQ